MATIDAPDWLYLRWAVFPEDELNELGGLSQAQSPFFGRIDGTWSLNMALMGQGIYSLPGSASLHLDDLVAVSHPPVISFFGSRAW